MLWKNRNKKVGLCVVIVTICFILAALWAVMATPETALAKKPGGGGGGEVGQDIPVCIVFDDAVGDDVKSDGDFYCDGDSNKKVTAIVGRNFSIVLETNNSKKRTAGRTLWLDLGNPVGCATSVNVDVSDGAGGDVDGICDPCFDSVPDLPAERFGTPPLGQKFGYPDRAKLQIWGRDLDGLRVGNAVDTSSQMNFSVGGQSWVLYWGSFKVPGGWTYAPNTSAVTVTRLDNDTWRITCAGDACLYRDNNPPHRATEYHGQVIVPFGMTAVAITHEETVWGDEPWDIIPGDTTPCIEQ